MSAAFDPYYKWLGIPPQDQPPDHYRLLGLTHFEGDPQVIESAADRQMVHLRTFATGPHGALSQKLLNEVAAARVCLLNAAKKAAYDESLRGRLESTDQHHVLAAVHTATAAHAPPLIQTVGIPMVEVPVIATANRPIARARKTHRPMWQHPGVVSAAVTLVILVVAIGFALRGDGEPIVNEPSAQPPQRQALPTAPRDAKVQQASNATLGEGNRIAAGLTTIDPQATDGSGSPGQQDSPTSLGGNRNASGSTNKSVGDGNNSQAVAGNGNASPPVVRPAYEPGRRLGLLRSLDLLRHRVEGDWQRTNGELSVAPGKARMRLPYRPGSQPYELHIAARRDSGNDALIVGLAFQGREFLVLLDRGGTTLLSHVDGQRQSSDAQWQRSIFTPGEFADIVITVREEGLSIVTRNESLGSFSAYDRLSANPDWNEGQGLLLLASSNSAFTISKIILTPLAPATPNNVAANTGTPPQTSTDAADTASAPGAFQGVRPPSSGQKPAPSGAALSKAEATFKQAFENKLKQASRPADKAMLARELAIQARTATGDPADHFVLLTQARQLAADAGEVALAIELVTELERHFENDYWPSRLKTLSAAADNAVTAEARQAIVTTTLDLAEQASKQDQYEHAAELCGLAASAAIALKDADQTKAAKDRQTQYKNRQKQWDLASQANEKLKHSPDDAAANLIWGKYVCLVRGDWKEGVKFLAKGSDTRLRDAAEQELAAENSAESRAKTGDSWFAVSEPNKTEKLAYLNRAKQWYEQAAPQLATSERSRVEKRIGEINEQVHRLTGGKGRAVFPPTGLVGRVLVGGKDANLVIHYQPTKGFNADALNELLARHKIKGNGIRVELAGVMRLPVDTYSHFFAGGNGGAMLNHLYIDGAESHQIDASGKVGKYGMTNLLRAGDYYIRWVLAGASIEDCSMGIESTQNYQPLPILHTPEMLNKLKPQRAKEEVDVSRP